MASEKKEPVATEEQSNGDKNGENGNPKLSLGEIAAIDSEIAKAKTDQLQLLHNLFYGKNGSAPQIKRNIRKFAGFETDDRQKKLDQLLTSELPALQQTVTILDIKDVKEDETKENVSKAIVDFLMAPSGKTIAEVEKENPVEDEAEDEEEPENDEEEEEQVKPKGSPKKGDKNQAGRPKRATAARVWTKDYGSSEEEEQEAEGEEEDEVEEERPKVGRKRKNDSDSGSDYNPNADSDSEADRRKSNRAPAPGTRKSGRPAGRKAKAASDSEESEENSDEDFSEEELPKKKKTPARAPAKRGRQPAKRGRKRKQESESEDEESPDESEEEAEASDDSEKPKKKVKPSPKSTPQKNSKGRPKRAAPPAKKKKKVESDEEEQSDEPEESEDDEPLKKPPKKGGASSPAGEAPKLPTDDEIKILLKDILADANLEEITMKTVCKKVYAHYPGHDLTKKKDFIKQTVKSLIAT